MKAVYYISLVCYCITVVGYVDLILGMFLQAGLGIIHVALSLYALFKTAKTPPAKRKKLNLYFILVVLYFGSLAVGKALDPLLDQVHVDFGLIYVTVVPMLIGLYFVYVAYKLRNEK